MKIMLAFPPQFDPSMPNLALPCLTAVLREAGHEVTQKDLNVESYDILLSKEELERAFEKIQVNYNSLSFLGTDTQELSRLMKRKDFLCNEVEQAKRVFRNQQDFYDYRCYCKSKTVINDSLKLISLTYFGSQLSLDSFTMYYSPDSTQQVLQAVKTPDYNLFYDFFSRYTIPQVRAESPRVLGISIAVQSQVIPGLTLAYLVKQALPNTYIVIGGNYFTLLKDNLAKNQELFSLFNGVVIYEGETAIIELVNCLNADDGGVQGLAKVPNLIYRNGAEIVCNEIRPIEKLNSLPAPSFEGLPLSLYFSPFRLLPIYASRGCYWGECAFCSFSYSSSHRYSIRDSAMVRGDIEQITRKYNCSFFVFIDEVISPHYLEQFADEILEAGMNIQWTALVRFEKEFNRELLAKMAKSGCRVLGFGLESSDDQTLALMKKGTTAAVIKEVLRASYQSGIFCQTSFIIGFPMTTLEETKETMEFIFDNIFHISAMAFGHFHLLIGSNIYLHPGEYGIVRIYTPKEFDLSLFFNYEVKNGLALKEAATIAKWFRQIFEEQCLKSMEIFYLLSLANHYHTNNLLWLTASGLEKFFGKKRFMKSRLRKTRQKAAVLFNNSSIVKKNK